MPAPKGITSLSAYVASLRTSEHGEFAARAASRVAHEEAFADMKGHILGLYEKVEAAHSFQDETGAIFDCIPVEQQPALPWGQGSHTESTRSSAARRGRFAAVGVARANKDDREDVATGSPLRAGSQGPARQRHAMSRGHDPDATGHARGHDPIPDAPGIHGKGTERRRPPPSQR